MLLIGVTICHVCYVYMPLQRALRHVAAALIRRAITIDMLLRLPCYDVITLY